MSGWRVADDRHGLSIEKGTDSVPDDDRFHVIVDGEIVLSTRVEALAVAEFEDIRDQRNAARNERLEKMRGDAAFIMMRRDSYRAKKARDSRRGGRGVGR